VTPYIVRLTAVKPIRPATSLSADPGAAWRGGVVALRWEVNFARFHNSIKKLIFVAKEAF